MRKRLDPEAIRVPGGRVDLHESGLTVTHLAGCPALPAWPQENDEYRERARALGYGDDVGAMSRDHELGHHLLAALFGLVCAPSLEAAALRNGPCEVADAEECAVLALQRYMRAVNGDMRQALRCAMRGTERQEQAKRVNDGN